LNKADENKLIGEHLSWEQFPLEELLEGLAVLALVEIERGIGIRVEPVGLPKSHDQLVEH
jgi:hypothetical protein